MIPGSPRRPARELYGECRSREKQISRSPQEIPADGPAVEFETAGQGEMAVDKQIDTLATGRNVLAHGVVHDRAGKFFLCSTGHLPNPAAASGMACTVHLRLHRRATGSIASDLARTS